MKILHICLAAFYVDNYSYQENMLPKYHKRLGYDVSILASLQTFDSNGNASYLKKADKYINEYGIPVNRIEYKKLFKPIVRKLKIYKNVYENIKSEKPDIIFIHGCQFSNMREIKKYLKENPKTKVFVDNHCDFSNSATNWFSKNVLHKILWRHSAKIIEPYANKFYGVLPSRVEFLKDMYKIDEQKVELLVMGADDDLVEEANKISVRNEIREKYGIKENDFLIVTGGKIDNYKKQTLLLMEAVNKINKDNIKLIVFGSVIEELQHSVNKLAQSNNTEYIGWINSNEAYNFFGASDLVIFPGRHSVLWEQAVGTGVPIVAKYWDGTTHININNNCIFLKNDSVDEIIDVIKLLSQNNIKYNEMLKNSRTGSKERFSYLNIAKKSIEL